MKQDGLDTSGFGQENMFGPQFVLGAGQNQSPYQPQISFPSPTSTQQFIPWTGIGLNNYGGYFPFNLPSAVTGAINFGAPQSTAGGGSQTMLNQQASGLTLSYYDSSSGSPVQVDVPSASSLFIQGSVSVTDDGSGNLTAVISSGGSSGTLTSTLPITGSGSMASNITLALNYDTTNSFASGSSLTLKSVSQTVPVDFGLVSDISVDSWGRVTAWTRQWMGFYKITSASRVSGQGYWSYSLKRQEQAASWPFVQDATTYDSSNPLTITAYNMYEIGNTTSVAAGYNISNVSGTSDPSLTDYTGYKLTSALTGQLVQVWKIGSVYMFSSINRIYGTCP